MRKDWLSGPKCAFSKAWRLRSGMVGIRTNNLAKLGLLYERQGQMMQALALMEQAAQIAKESRLSVAAPFRQLVEKLRTKAGEAG